MLPDYPREQTKSNFWEKALKDSTYINQGIQRDMNPAAVLRVEHHESVSEVAKICTELNKLFQRER